MLPLISAEIAVASLPLGMAVGFFLADRHSPANRALAAAMGVFALSLLAAVAWRHQWLSFTTDTWSRLFSIGEAVTLLLGFQWLLRIGRATQLPIARAQPRLLRSAQLLVLLYLLACLLWPEGRRTYLVSWEQLQLDNWRYWLFLGPLYLSVLLACCANVALFAANPERAERVRVVAMFLAAPFWLSALVVDPAWMTVPLVVGQLIFLAGAMRYHVLQGKDGEFLSRFLSPDVAELVRVNGVRRAMHEQREALTVVNLDLRGFTAYSEAVSTAEVMSLLKRYYAVVGDAATEVGATVKDHSGDGVLVVVGAPIRHQDHAARAVWMAQLVMQRMQPLLADLSGPTLGLGIGVASGRVTTGALEAATRLEYVAVGRPVYLSARLCSHAEAGQILLDEHCAQHVRQQQDVLNIRLQPLAEQVQFKGLQGPETVYRIGRVDYSRVVVAKKFRGLSQSVVAG